MRIALSHRRKFFKSLPNLKEAVVLLWRLAEFLSGVKSNYLWARHVNYGNLTPAAVRAPWEAAIQNEQFCARSSSTTSAGPLFLRPVNVVPVILMPSMGHSASLARTKSWSVGCHGYKSAAQLWTFLPEEEVLIVTHVLSDVHVLSSGISITSAERNGSGFRFFIQVRPSFVK